MTFLKLDATVREIFWPRIPKVMSEKNEIKDQINGKGALNLSVLTLIPPTNIFCYKINYKPLST